MLYIQLFTLFISTVILFGLITTLPMFGIRYFNSKVAYQVIIFLAVFSTISYAYIAYMMPGTTNTIINAMSAIWQVGIAFFTYINCQMQHGRVL